MSELNRLREMRARLADPDPERLAAVRAQVTGRFGARSPGRGRAFVPRRTGLRLAVVAVVLALAAGVTAVQVVGGHRGGPFATPDAAAANLLNRAAAAADAEPDIRPRKDQYVYIEQRRKELTGPPLENLQRPYPVKSPAAWSPDDPPYYVDRRTEQWQSVVDKGQILDRDLAGHPTPFAPGMRLPARMPGLGGGEEFNALCEPGSPYEPNYRWMSTLPTDPDRLRGEIFGDAQPPAAKWQVISDMLTMGVPSARLRASLFRLGGTIPGVTVAGHAEDAAGHHGMAIEFTYAWGAIDIKMVGQLIFDPKTYRYLGSRDLLGERYAGLAAGTLWQTSSVVTMKAVDRLPRVQHGTVRARC
ncbi:CU044_5270 family protein [Actinomadura sp. DC4]|uniref:CU044_5270 family protein n=1 Tax=Actinomadura sp. DC4 TaxID=3055069 RepID=UPI0025AF5E67|nr:CU044_5270 family protein [Actinomadura sp. DC4]MDN3356406.1 CU044_5270 family protein [Actinomadura sp. DC4]